MSVLFRLCLVAALASPVAALAQSEEEYGDEGYSPFSFEVPAKLPSVPGERNARDAGPRIVQALEDATSFCQAILDEAYHVDCLAERLDFIADHLPQNGPYAEARKVIDGAATDLRAVARTYGDRGKPAVKVSSGGSRPQTTARPLTPVRAEDVAVAKAEATRIIEEAETVLLRSSDTNVAVAQQVRSIAAAVGSNKVLLRSS
jgi:hypothetical protein